jgi:Sulfotransferase family
MTLPNFLIVGAAKSGTTALYHYLKQHPQVYMSPTKETNFFAFEGQEVRFHGPGDEKIAQSTITSLEAYKEQFAAVSNEIAIGEASPWYLYSDQAVKNIYRHIPDVKLIAVLRNPAERAFSSYLHVARDGRENLTFEEGLLVEEKRIEQGWEFIWHYQRTGFYAAQVERFLDLFPREQIRFYLYDDLLANPVDFMRNIYEFLSVDTNFVVDTSLKPNATGVPKSQLLGRLLLQPNPLRTTVKVLVPKQLRYNLGQRINQRLLEKPHPNKETYRKLLSSYKDDISTLQDLVGRDLSAWTDGHV